MSRIVFQWIEPCTTSERLRKAQAHLRESVLRLGLEPVLFPAGPSLVKFREILQFARDRANAESFVWCNSDVTLRRNPFEIDDGRHVQGFHRTEIPSGSICGGVDMYLIPCRLWDDWIRDDSPDMWCGATHIDWWLSRTAQKKGIYRAHEGFIDHLTHPTSDSSKLSTDPYYQHNIQAYNEWAEKCGEKLFRPEEPSPVWQRFFQGIAWRARWKAKGLATRLKRALERGNSVTGQRRT